MMVVQFYAKSKIHLNALMLLMNNLFVTEYVEMENEMKEKNVTMGTWKMKMGALQIQINAQLKNFMNVTEVHLPNKIHVSYNLLHK